MGSTWSHPQVTATHAVRLPGPSRRSGTGTVALPAEAALRWGGVWRWLSRTHHGHGSLCASSPTLPLEREAQGGHAPAAGATASAQQDCTSHLPCPAL